MSTSKAPELITGPSTSRGGETLAVFYGFTSIYDFANDLPPEATVIDVGAGLSTLGHDVTRLREDISWSNFDIVYGDQTQVADFDRRRLDQLTLSAPTNLQYDEGNILDPARKFRVQRFTHIFSYYMLPHIVRNGSEAGVTAIINMLNMGVPGGTLSIGPGDMFSRAVQLPTAGTDSEKTATAERLVANWERNRELTDPQ